MPEHKTLTELGLPESFKKHAHSFNTNLVLISGAPLSGKTSTMEAIKNSTPATHNTIITIDEINDKNHSDFISTVINKDVNEKVYTTICSQSGLTGTLTTIKNHSHTTGYDLNIPLGTVVIFQKLIKQLCPNCKQTQNPTETDIKDSIILSYLDHDVFTHSLNGCDSCNFTGYKGKLPIYEVMEITPDIQNHIYNNTFMDNFSSILEQENILSLKENGYMKVAKGLTSLTEIKNVNIIKENTTHND